MSRLLKVNRLYKNTYKNIKKQKEKAKYGRKLIAKEFRKELIINATDAEKILYEKLEKEKILFYFQKDIHHNNSFRLADFYFPRGCLTPLIIEIDGKIHYKKKNWIDDRNREKFLKEATGCEILRFNNSKVFNELDEIIHIIKSKNILNDDGRLMIT